MACLFHKWNGCKCEKCGKTRDKNHRWDLCKGICIVCGSKCAEQHEWDGCKCQKCGNIDGKRVGAENKISEINDLSILLDIIRNHNVVPIRKAAIDRRRHLIKNMKDQTALLEIVNSDKEYIVDNRVSISVNFKEIAAQSITDMQILSMLAREHEYGDVRFQAVLKITDQSVLEQVALYDDYEQVRCAAICRLTNQTVLKEIVQSNLSYKPRLEAVRKVTDQSFLESMARNDREISVRYAAIDMLTDQSTLAEIASADFDSFSPHINIKALMRITDSDLLHSVTRKAISEVTKKKAIKVLGGYFCISCNHENLPEDGKSITCSCKKCKAENHDYKNVYNTTSLPGHAEKNESYEKCIRCGKEQNYAESIRFTDW